MREVTITDVLVSARALLAKPGGWSKGKFGRDANGKDAAYLSEAESHCAYGALQRVYSETKPNFSMWDVVQTIEAVTPGNNIVSFNDRQEDNRLVLDVFDMAIAKMRCTPEFYPGEEKEESQNEGK